MTAMVSKAIAGTTRALVNNMVKGVSEGWQKKLLLNGVGYRAKADGGSVNLTGPFASGRLQVAEGVSVETPPDGVGGKWHRQTGSGPGGSGDPQLPSA